MRNLFITSLLTVIITLGNFSILVGQEKGKHLTGEKTPKIVMYGKVLDVSGQPIVGASLVLKDFSYGVTTDSEGRYRLVVDSSRKKDQKSSSVKEDIVLVSFISKVSLEVPLKNGEHTFILQDDANYLDEVIVTGYQNISKERATGSFAIVKPEQLKANLEPNVLTRLEGVVAGYSKSQIRGITTLLGESRPLIVVDGLPYDGSLSYINPSTISNITVLKDAAAASIYGAKAANGIIVITTKQGEGDGKVHISYNGSVRVTPEPDLNSLNLMSSKELIDLNVYGFQFSKATLENLQKRFATNPVTYLLLENRAGLISDSELQSKLDVYRNSDNRQEIRDFYLRKGILYDNNVSLSGGTKNNRYFINLNYRNNKDNVKDTYNNSVGFSLKDNIRFLPWMSGDIVLAANYDKSHFDKELSGFNNFFLGYPSYTLMKRDGKLESIPKDKSEYELERLREIGLNDETYNPITNKGKELYDSKQLYHRMKVGLKFNIMQGLDLDLMYSNEQTGSKSRTFYKPDSYKVLSMVNNAAVRDKKTNEITYNVPQGGQLSQVRGDISSYTLRGQLSFNRDFGKHMVSALAGAERRRVKATSTKVYYMGYDNNSLAYEPVDPYALASLRGTEALRGYFSWYYDQNNRVTETEDRFVSFYANGSYSFDKKYGITGSIRIDQSNLFGVAIRNQYRPLWSVGTSLTLSEYDFIKQTSWIDYLKLRATYGIGGNVPKNAGPYLTLYAPTYSYWLNDFESEIKSPPNPYLRWEKTATTNLGLDFALLDGRLGGSLEVYKKKTNDLLAMKEADPTLGWDQLLLNYGAMKNFGVELSLDSRLKFGEVTYIPRFTFAYNKNEITNVKNMPNTIFDYTRSPQNITGYPMSAIFSVKGAGLSSKNGEPLFINEEGKKVNELTDVKDVVYSGTAIPKYTSSLSSSIQYKNFDLSFMFMFYGGHVMRGPRAPYLSNAPSVNISRDALNVWKKPGDELNPDAVPAYTGNMISPNKTHQWAVSDENILDADYLKLRNLSLSYTLDRNVVRALPIQSLRFTLQVRNVFTWTKNSKNLDPEAMSVYYYSYGTRTFSQPTIYTFGISANF